MAPKLTWNLLPSLERICCKCAAPLSLPLMLFCWSANGAQVFRLVENIRDTMWASDITHWSKRDESCLGPRQLAALLAEETRVIGRHNCAGRPLFCLRSSSRPHWPELGLAWTLWHCALRECVCVCSGFCILARSAAHCARRKCKLVLDRHRKRLETVAVHDRILGDFRIDPTLHSRRAVFCP